MGDFFATAQALESIVDQIEDLIFLQGATLICVILVKDLINGLLKLVIGGLGAHTNFKL